MMMGASPKGRRSAPPKLAWAPLRASTGMAPSAFLFRARWRLSRDEPLELVACRIALDAPRPRPHDGTIITDKVNEMWGTDMTQTITIREGRANVFVAVEHANSEVVGIHASRSANRFEALEPVRQGVHRCFGAIAPGVARGLKLRHDHGSNYMSGDFQDEIECLGIEASPSFVREPEGNGVAERFIRTL